MTAQLRTSVDIDAPAERVWDVLTDVRAYPQWNRFITGAEGSFAVGNRITFTLPPLNALLRMTVRCTVLEVISLQRLRFRLRLARLDLPGLFDADHVLSITPRDGGVRLWEDAQFRGVLVPLLSRSFNRENSSAFAATNDAFKDQVEGRSAG
jgi:hypothetical protein